MTEVPDVSMLHSMVRDKGCAHCHDLTDLVRKLNAEQSRVHQEARQIIADMKSNHGTHKDYIKRLELALDGAE